MCAMYLEHSPPVITSRYPQSSHSYVIHGVENCEWFAFELVNVHPLFLLSGHHEALFSTLMLRELFSSDFSCYIQLLCLVEAVLFQHGPFIWNNYGMPSVSKVYLKFKPRWFHGAIWTSLLITRMLCKSLWIDEDETQMTSFQDCPLFEVPSQRWKCHDLICYFSTCGLALNTVIRNRWSVPRPPAILHSLFTLGDGWASDSVSETQPSMLFLELILNASRITNLLFMFWI